jgi:serine/threonine-protein kinase
MMRIFKLVLLLIGFSVVIGVGAYLAVVFLVESEETVIVPDLIGKDVVYCLELLTDLGLDVKVKGSEYSDTVANHHVIDQDPDPGAVIKKGRDINLFLSKGKKYIQLPDLRRESLNQVRLVLEANGLHTGIISETFHDRSPRQQVIAQEPRPGRMIARGTAVDLLISKGGRPTAYVMPDLSGTPFSSAALVLEDLGLTAGEIKAANDDRFPRNTVIDQDPAAGFRVTEGDRVDLTVNRVPGEERAPLLNGGGVTLFRYKLEKGFLNRHIKILLNCYGLSIPVIDDFKKPGDELWVLVPSHRDATVFVYVDHELDLTEVFGGG